MKAMSAPWEPHQKPERKLEIGQGELVQWRYEQWNHDGNTSTHKLIMRSISFLVRIQYD